MSVLLAACGSAPAVVEEPYVEEPVIVVTEPEPEVYTQELYDNTLAELREFIEGINQIIQRRDYNSWRGTLSEELYARFSSTEFLANASASPSLSSRNIVLRTANDYFIQVIVPSRANSRIDDIEFITEYNVRAYTIDNTRGRLVLYDLTRIDGQWKIAN